MAVRSAVAPPDSGSAGAELQARILAQGVSKQYPGRRVVIFPPVLSIFERDLNPFRRDRSSTDARSRAASRVDEEYDLDEDDEDEDELDRELGPPPPTRARPDELFWALKDVSLSLRPGRALGVLGGPGAGKSTLMRILGGRAFPTEGRVLVRGSVSPLPEEVHKALALAVKTGENPVLACRLLGVGARTSKRHRAEIEELAQPLLTPDGDPAPGARVRLAVAATAVLPSDTILLDQPRGTSDEFMERIVERLRERLRSGSSLVFASRQPGLVQELCDEVILLSEGTIADRGDARRTAGKYAAMPKAARDAVGAEGAEAGSPIVQGQDPLHGRQLRVPDPVAPFGESAALLSVEVLGAAGERSKRIAAGDELSVEINLETALANIDVRCAVRFTQRAQGKHFRVELPEPLRLAHEGNYTLAARLLPGALPGGGYSVRGEAIVAAAAGGEACVIARDIGRLRIVGNELGPAEPVEAPVTQWDGSAAWLVEAEWSIR